MHWAELHAGNGSLRQGKGMDQIQGLFRGSHQKENETVLETELWLGSVVHPGDKLEMSYLQYRSSAHPGNRAGEWLERSFFFVLGLSGGCW